MTSDPPTTPDEEGGGPTRDTDDAQADDAQADEAQADEAQAPDNRRDDAESRGGESDESDESDESGSSEGESRGSNVKRPYSDTSQQRRKHVALPHVPGKRGPIERRISRLFRKVESRAQTSGGRRARASAYTLGLAAHVVHQWARDRCHEKAASLAFQTILSVVPLLAVALAVLRGSGSIDAQSSFVDFLGREFVPVSREVIAERLTEWSDNVNLQSLGLIGLVAVLLMAFVMVNSIEKTINAIWRAERKRSLAQKFIVFYATATIGPFLVGTSLYQAGKFGWTDGYKGLIISVLTGFVAIFLANYFLPAIRVRFVPALLGALVSTLLFEMARIAFRAYVTEYAFPRFSGIYGPISLVPIWLLWIYYSWLTFLLGIEVAHVAQNLHILQRSDRRRPLSLENEILQRVNGVTAARVMMAISAAYLGGDKVMPRRALEDIFDLSDDVLSRITNRLVERDLIIEVAGDHPGFLPARPPSEIALADVLAAFRSDDLGRSGDGPRTVLDRILLEIQEDTNARTQSIDFDELVRGRSEQRR